MKMGDLCKRVGLVALCVVLLCAAINIDRIINGFAASSSAVSDPNTTEIKFDSNADLEDFEMWYAPTLTPAGVYPAIGNADSNWKVRGGQLSFQTVADRVFNDLLTGESKQVAVDVALEDVTYQSKSSAYNNFGIAVLNAQTYTDFELEVTVGGNAMVGFGASNTSYGVFPSQQKGGYAFLIEQTAVKLIGYGAASPWSVLTTGTIASRASHTCKITVSGGKVTLTVDGTAAVSAYALPGYTGGYVYLAANHAEDSFSNLTVTGSAAATYTFNKVQEMTENFTMWYMPTGNSTAEVPAIKMDYAPHTGNWYVMESAMRFVHDTHYLFQANDRLSAGVTMAVYTDDGDLNPEIEYKSTSAADAIGATSNFGVAMLKTQKYKDFRLTVDVAASDGYSYIGFGAQGGSYGAHIGQPNGGYAFHAQDGMAIVSSYDPDNGGQYDLLSAPIAYDAAAAHHYVIEVKGNVATITVDTGNDPVRVALPMYESGYIYFASNDDNGGFSNVTIAELGAAEDEAPVDISNRAVYNFDKRSDLDAFEFYYVYSSFDMGKPAIRVTDPADANWYLDRQQTLSFKRNSLYVDNATIAKGFTKDVTLDDGTTSSVTFRDISGYPDYSANYGVALLKERKYTNFILDVDIKPSTHWIHIGFDAQGGNYGVFRTQPNGGYALRIIKDGTNDAATLQLSYTTGKNFTVPVAAKVPFSYSDGGYRHLRLVVSDTTMYAYVDDITNPIIATLPNNNGGYIYFALNDEAGGFDNLQITDLDKKKITIAGVVQNALADVIEINRAEGQSLSDVFATEGGVLDAVDVNGYAYKAPMSFESDTYRSWIAGDHEFAMIAGDTAWKNMTIIESDDAVPVIVRNNLDVDPETTRKYYFDHLNDIMDFMSYHSVPLPDNTMSGWKGNLEEVEDIYEYWTVENNCLTNTNPVNPGYYNAKNVSNVLTFLLKDLKLFNFQLEFDYTHAENNWWYTYMLIGVQEPNRGLRMMDPNGAIAYNAFINANISPGIWMWTTQEGQMSYAGDVGNRRRQFASAQLTRDIDLRYRSIYAANRDAVHHFTCRMINGIFTYQIDESPKIYLISHPDAVGGFVGLATHRHGSTIDNFEITAMDESGDPMKIADAKQGMAPTYLETGYTGWDPEDDFEWSSDYQQ